jgi:hypothetical protein
LLDWRDRLRQTSLRARIVAAVVAAAVVTAAVLTVVESSPSAPPPYASLPAPCSVISLAALATYLPNPTGTPISVSSASTYKEAACEWSSTAGGEVRTVVTDVVIFSSSSGSPNATDAARQFYSSALSALGCHCPATAVSARSVPGLGDQATALVATADPDAVEITPSGGVIPGLTLLVASRNAGIELNYRSAVAATAAALPADAGKLTGIIAMARGILAELGGRAAGSAAPVTAEPHYAGPRDPCRLVRSATLAKYAPGATVSPGITSSGAPQSPNGSPNPDGSHTTTCSWDSGSNGLVSLSLNVFPDAVRAQQGFDTDAHALSQSSISGITVTGDQWLTDLGEDGAVIYQTHSTHHSVQILVWSGNIELDYWFTPAASLDRATLLAAGVAMARDGLAALASRSASSYPLGPVYASPHDTCKLIKASTLARYAPGASVDTVPAAIGGPFQISNCAWGAPDGTLFLDVTIYSDADGALGGYQSDTQAARQNQNGNRFNGSQPVKGLGDQATAIFETSLGFPEVDLYVLLGNAQVEISFADLPFSPTLSRDEKLAADIAMIRDVLAGLPRT